MYLLLPLAAAIAFALGSIVFKRAYAEGARIGHTVVVTNVLLGVVFLPLACLDAAPVPWRLWHLPAMTAGAFAAGHLLNLLALRTGDVSLATPLLGAKPTFVVLLSWLVFHAPPGRNQWVAAGMTSLGVLLMGATDLRPGRRAGATTALSLGCAALFALTDVSIQAWSGRLGAWNFLSLQFGALGLVSACLLPFLGPAPLRAPAAAWRWSLAATALTGLQSILITGTIAVWKDAAGVNVVYATRGLWSVALVWSVGHHLRNAERHATGSRVLFLRFAGAAWMLVAVVLAVRDGLNRPP